MGNSESIPSHLNPEKIVEKYLIDGWSIPIKNPTVIPVDSSGEMVDEQREYKDLCTEIVVKLFLSSDLSMFNFLKLVYQTYESALNFYKKSKHLSEWDIFFVYKGGNILRIIANDFLGELPTLASRNIHQYYDKFFKRSDADFSIYINPSISTYDTVYQEITYISYLLQDHIRTAFMTNLVSYFDFYKYSPDYKKILLSKYVGILKGSKSITDLKNHSYYGLIPTDIIFDHHPDYTGKIDTLLKPLNGLNDQSIQISELNDHENSMFIQVNETLDFKSSAGRVKFNLVRTKILFNLVFRNYMGQQIIHPVGGELIDVSIPHKFDNNLLHFYEVGTDYIQQYKLTNQDNQIELIFYSYKYTYLSHDLEYILFKFVDKPWETPKYEKRLNRLMYLYYLDLFVKYQEMSPRKRMIDEMVSVLSDSNFSSQTPIIKLEKNMLKYQSKNLLISTLCENLIRVMKFELNDSSDLIAFNQMKDIILLNFAQMSKSMEGINSYCSQEGSIKLDVLYDNDFTSLIGGGRGGRGGRGGGRGGGGKR